MLARHPVLLTPSIAASLPRTCRGAECTFLVPDARSRPKNLLSSFLATDPKKHLLSPNIATLPKRPEITPVFATHPRPPWRVSRFRFTPNAGECKPSSNSAFISYHLSPFLSNSCALFCPFLHASKTQLFCFQSLPHSLPETPAGVVLPPLLTVPKSSTYDVSHDFGSRRVLLQKRSESLRPAFETLRSAKRNNHRENLFRRRRHHGSLRITRRAAVWPSGVGEQWQAFQVQVVLADALVCFARASRAKNNFAGHMPQVIQSDRQPALHRHEVNHVHHGINLWQALSCDHPPQQRFRRTPVSRWIFSQRFVRPARRDNLRPFQPTPREKQFLAFRPPSLPPSHPRVA